MKKIVVVGSLNMDFAIHTDGLPHMGETVIGKNFARIPGGKGANQAVAAARLGGDVSMIGCVGDDIFGMELIENLRSNNVSTGEILVQQNSSTGIAMIIVNNGDNCIILNSGANYEITPEYMKRLEKLISKADILVTQMEIPLEVVELALHTAKKHGLFVILNPAPAQKLEDEMLKNVDVIVPNEIEAEHLTGIPINTEENMKDTIDFFHAKGIPHCIITLGAKGVAYGGPNGFFRFPACSVDVTDSTAAGDSFVGALATQVAQEMPIEKAIQFCNIVAALTVTKHGAQSSLPTLKEVEEFYSSL